MQTIDEYFKKIQNMISNSKIVASTNIEYIKVLENEGYMRGTQHSSMDPSLDSSSTQRSATDNQ